MDHLCLAFPHICAIIFQHLDDKSLTTCRLINKTWKKCVDSEKIVWHRIIDKLVTCSDDWSLVIDKIPFDILKEIGQSILLNFHETRKENVNYNSHVKHYPVWLVFICYLDSLTTGLP